MLKRFALIFMTLVLALSLAACGSPATPTPTPVETGKVETINNISVDFEKNDIIVIKDYQGSYADTLEPMLVEFPGEGSTYQIAVFGNLVNLYFYAGRQGSELFTQEVAARVSNKLITFEGAPPAGGDDVAGIGFMDANGERYEFSLAANADHKGVLMIADSGIHSASVAEGNILLATYKNGEYTFTVEASQTELVQNEPVNYLYLQKEGQDKLLLTQSVDKGEDWTESVRNILNPVLSADAGNVYYVTDIENRMNGAGANNLFTRKIDMNSNEERLLASGALFLLLTDEAHAPFGGNLILKGHELQGDKVVENYFMINPQGETLCYLGTSLEMYGMDLVVQIEQAMK